MQRISVVGSSGAGKTRFARRLGSILDLPVTEMDSLFHQPNWSQAPPAEFRTAVHARIGQDRWVVDGNYTSVLGNLVWAHADTVIWLDYSRSLVTRRVVTRSVGRVVRGEELWQGNRERWRNLLSWDPDKSIVRWTWTRHRATREKYAARFADPRWSHLSLHRLTSPSLQRVFLSKIEIDQ